MVEEMYKEEAVDAEMDSNSSSDIAGKTVVGDVKESEGRGEDILQSTTSTVTERCSAEQLIESKSDYFPDVEMMETNIGRPFQNDSNVLPDTAVVQSIEGNGRYMVASAAAYHMSELERFENGSGVSLTLGLQHSDGGTVRMPIQTYQNYIPMRGDDKCSVAAPSMGVQAADFDCMDSGNQQNRFASSQTLHDFVA